VAAPATAAPSPAGIAWRPWSPEAVDEVLAGGQGAFVDFTADWCVTCKANERLVIETDEISRALRDHDVVAFRADWTRKDERIRAKLADHGKAGVPMYLVYGPSRPAAPTVLPELLTTTIMKRALLDSVGAPDPKGHTP
jgi:thiol:disulfide interchange protein